MKNITDRDLILSVFYLVDEFVKSIDIDPKPGPQDKLHMSEILTLMLLHPILKPFKTLKTYHRWIEINFKDMFGKLPEYSRITRIFANNYEYLIVLMKKLSNQNGFGFVADGTCIGVMEAIRGKFAKCFRNARKVKSASKQQWYWGFILELVIDQEGKIAYFRVGTEAEVKQLEDILEDLADIWVLCDRGNRGEKMHARMWDEKQIKIKITGGKERQWIENVIGFMKENFGLEKIRKIRSMPSFLSKLVSMLCAYNTIEELDLAI